MGSRRGVAGAGGINSVVARPHGHCCGSVEYPMLSQLWNKELPAILGFGTGEQWPEHWPCHSPQQRLKVSHITITHQ